MSKITYTGMSSVGIVEAIPGGEIYREEDPTNLDNMEAAALAHAENAGKDGLYRLTTRQETFAQTSLFTPAFEPEILNPPRLQQFRTVDDAMASSIGGVTWDSYYRRLGLKWRNPNVGDYLGKDGPQGSVPFSVGSVPKIGEAARGFDVTELVTRAINTANRGFYLRLTGTNGPTIRWGGRAHTALAPYLVVETLSGRFTCKCILSATVFSKTTASQPVDTSVVFSTSNNRFGIVQFDLSEVHGAVVLATMHLYPVESFGSNLVLHIFELDPPWFQIGAGLANTATPTLDGATGVLRGQIALGLAAELGEAGLAAPDGTPLHPSVCCAGHFEGTTFQGLRATAPRIRGFENIHYANDVQILPDTDAPGTHLWRGTAVNVVPGSVNRGLFKKFYPLMFPDRSDPRFPIDVSKLVEEIYVRSYFRFGTDWTDITEGIKCTLGITLQFGYWVPVGNGYWQPDGGNSNSYGDGMKHLGDCHDNVPPFAPDGAPNQNYYFHRDRPTFTYKGHMQFNLGGYSGRMKDPHWDVRPLSGYNYNLDAPDVYGQGQSVLGNIVPARIMLGRWFCMEQYLKLNTVDLQKPIRGKKDGSFYENYEANPDGIHRTWLDGVLIDEKTNFRWRRNREMGIQGAGIEWYTGGNGTTDWPTPAHFDVNHVVVSLDRYIGPRVKP